jgi:single-stranded DNA-binding protein
MNVLTLNGFALSNAATRQNERGTLKTVFNVETDGGELPLHFSCIAFGTSAERAAKIVEGDEVLLSGRLNANAATKKMTVVVNTVEIMTEDSETLPTEKTQ